MNSNIVTRSLLITALVCISAGLLAQDKINISGEVVNSMDKPLKNIAVSYIGATESPVITDSTGAFSILVPNGDVWLSISTVGTYKKKTIFLDSRTDIKVFLVEEGEDSGHDIVEYMGSEYKKKDLTSGISSEIGGIPGENSYQTFDQNLQGKVAGLFQSNLSGMPGSGSYMLLRGLNSVNSINQPLIIIDGIPLENPGVMNSVVSGITYNPLASLDPNDISTIVLVKDGEALTNYGLKGSNGLIIIQTLKPVETNTSIDFQYKAGMSVSDYNIPQLEAYDYKTYAKEVLSSSPFKEEQYADLFPGLYYLDTQEEYLRYSHNTNWQELIFRNSLVQDAYISVKGGDAIARYGLSVGYLNHNGIIENTNYNRVSSRFVGTFNIFSGLRMYVSANLVSTNADYKESALGEQTSPIFSALRKSPQMYSRRYDQNGNLLEQLDDIDELGVSNPAAIINNYSAGFSNYRFLTSFKIEGDISKNLKLNSILGLNINDLKELVFMPNYGMELYFDKEAYNASQSLKNLLFTISNDNYLTYNTILSNIHKIDLRVGARWQSNNFQEDLGLSMNSNENDQYTDLGSGDNLLRYISGRNQKWNWLSNYYSGNYVFRDKYMASASVSADFSSRVGKLAENTVKIGGQPFGVFYNLGAAWRISNESFMSGFNKFGDLKLRVNYGTSGNDDIGNQNSYKYYGLILFRETSGLIPGGFANDYLSFEKTKQLSAGIDLGIMENRLKMSAVYYKSSTDNMLIFEQLPVYVGYDLYPSNNGALSNNGYELSLQGRLVKTTDFSLDLGLNLSHFSSMISKMPDDEIITELAGGASIINRVGEPANSFYGYDYMGVYSTSSDASAAGLVNETGIPYRAGDAIFRDISGPGGAPDSVINEYDKILLGSAIPDYFGGLFLKMEYKRFGFYMQWQFTYGNEIYNHIRYLNERMTDLSNQSTAVLNRWLFDGQETNIPRALWNDPVGNSDFSSRWIEDGSYARLKQVTLSYRIDEEVMIFRNLTVFLTGNNLLTLSRYLSYDPEFSFSADPMMQGIDYGLMPIPRTVMAGIKFGL